MDDSLKEKIKVRSYIKRQDEGFIYSTWLNGLYYGNQYFKEIDKAIFMEHYHMFIERILSRENIDISIACLEDDDDVILAYCVHADERLHWTYTKPAWRKFGIAKLIIPSSIKIVTHLTKVGKAIKPREWIYNPFLI